MVENSLWCDTFQRDLSCPRELTKQKLNSGSSGLEDRSFMELLWRPKDFLGVLYDNHISKHVFS